MGDRIHNPHVRSSRANLGSTTHLPQVSSPPHRSHALSLIRGCTTLTVKPDGTKLFTAWYDRRADPGSNFLIQTYGVFANLPITGTNNFATNVVLSTVAFPPVFSGTQTNLGEYDPVYPPLFDGSDSRYCGSFVGTYKQENGDYSGATSDNSFVYYAWSDNRNTATNHSVIRHQRDVRAVRFSWPR